MDMFYVYVLESESNGKLYIGQTNDPEKRLNDYSRGASTYTKNKGLRKQIFIIGFKSRIIKL